MDISIQGASEHNLRNISTHIGDGLTVITGVSGSGKTSLVFDTLYHEARRRLHEVISYGRPGNRQYQMNPAKVETITGLGPAVLVGQNILNRNPLSTLASASGLHAFLRLLFTSYGTRHCPRCGTAPETRRGLDLLLAQDALQASNIGYEVARITGAEKDRGFFTYFARYDLAFILDLCRRVGASTEDVRVSSIIEFVKGLQSECGLWEYLAHPEASRWLTFDLLCSLAGLDKETGRISSEPVTPFQPYPKTQRRY